MMDGYEVRQAAVIVAETVRLALSERLGDLHAEEAFEASIQLEQVLAFYRQGHHYAAERSGVWPFELCGIKKYCEEFLLGFSEQDVLLGKQAPSATQLFHSGVVDQIHAQEDASNGR